MSDFLISFGSSIEPGSLLALLKQPYGQQPAEGTAAAFAWGSVAVLHDPIANQRNIRRRGQTLFAWVGELLFSGGEQAIARELENFDKLSRCGSEAFSEVKRAGLLSALNGGFSAFLANDNHVLVITDPLASVQVYLARDEDGHPIALGTHPDLVALARSDTYEIEPVSICDFLNVGIPCCPHTMHRDIFELAPGTAYLVGFSPDGGRWHHEFQYWVPPEEEQNPSREPELVEAFVESWHKAVVARCQGARVAVQLSGGMDSRLVLAAIPDALDCVTVTLCDSMNREARFAQRVADLYKRKWIPLVRDEEYLARTALPATHFTGCEGEWHHGHSLGFAAKFKELGITSVFTGLLMDNNFKGYYAQDLKRVSRWAGLLPAAYNVVPIDYDNQVSPFCRQHLRSTWVEGAIQRRRTFRQNHFARSRQSQCEWLDGYPYSQACDNTGWVIERRLMPIRLPLMDRSLVDLAFRVPIGWKAGGRFFDQAAVKILGKGASIPSANDGVRPGSGHCSRLMQRAVRKMENERRRILTSLGIRLAVPHSWHDFEPYLYESKVLGELIAQYGHHLREFGSTVFNCDPTTLLRNRAVPWAVGYRLIQLAIWRGVLDEYRPLRKQPLNEPVATNP